KSIPAGRKHLIAYLDVLDHLHSFHHLSKPGVVAIQMGSPLEHHKILTAFGVGARAGDAGSPARKSKLGSFRRQPTGGTAKPLLALQLSSLNNKMTHDAVQRNTFISAGPA